MLNFRVFFIFVVFTQSVALTWADRIWTFRSTANVVAAADDNPQVNGLGFFPSQGKNFKLGYEIYPSIFMNSIGPHLDLDFTYAFGFNKVVSSDLRSDSKSQAQAFE